MSDLDRLAKSDRKPGLWEAAKLFFWCFVFPQLAANFLWHNDHQTAVFFFYCGVFAWIFIAACQGDPKKCGYPRKSYRYRRY